ncbi:MAG: hypothetical protein ICV59_02350, partial [Thermoleophilia bacterium]|nr:hypothetical protein [Thermoleophilia bacterium]
MTGVVRSFWGRLLRPVGATVALALLVVPAGAGGWSAAGVGSAAAAESATTLAVIGDFGTNTASEAAVASMVGGWNAQAVVTTGDKYYGSAGGTGTGRYDVAVGK